MCECVCVCVYVCVRLTVSWSLIGPSGLSLAFTEREKLRSPVS